MQIVLVELSHLILSATLGGRWGLLPSFLCGDSGSERFSNLLIVTQLESGRSEPGMPDSRVLSWCSRRILRGDRCAVTPTMPLLPDSDGTQAGGLPTQGVLIPVGGAFPRQPETAEPERQLEFWLRGQLGHI